MNLSLKDTQKLKRKYIFDRLKAICPNVELQGNKWTTELVYYTASVVRGKVVVSRNTRGILLSSNPEKLAKYFYRTKDDAKKAIEEVLPKALEKFNKCNDELRSLKNRLGFSVDYTYDGDTYGIYDEYQYISFKMDNFDFSFEIG